MSILLIYVNLLSGVIQNSGNLIKRQDNHKITKQHALAFIKTFKETK